MRIAIVNFYYDEDIIGEKELCERYYTTTGLAEALQRKELEVVVVNRFSRDSFLELNDVKYYFVKDRFRGRLRSWQVALKCLKKIAQLEADLVHIHGISLTLQLFLLRILLQKKTAIIVQDHKSEGGKKRFIYNFFNSVADGFFFASTELGRKWLGFKWQFKRIYPLMEGSTFFNFETRDTDINYRYYDRSEARKSTGMTGSPVFLSVGRMHKDLDPLTVLEGMEIIFQNFPSARLYMIHSGHQLLAEVRKKIERSPILKQSVHLLGKIAHNRLKMYYDSCDYFVAGSRNEGSVFALSEALRCGCVPVVTNIPTFMMMTDDGKLGALWEPGNRNAMAEAAAIAMKKPLLQEAEACIAFFKEHLSFGAIAEQAAKYYGQVIAEKRKGIKQ